METGELTEEDAVRVHLPTSTEFLELCIVQYYTMNSLLCVLVVDGEQLLQPIEEDLLMLEGGLGQCLLLSVLLSPCQLGHSPVFHLTLSP